jgi:hypothetical protein
MKKYKKFFYNSIYCLLIEIHHSESVHMDKFLPPKKLDSYKDVSKINIK